LWDRILSELDRTAEQASTTAQATTAAEVVGSVLAGLAPVLRKGMPLRERMVRDLAAVEGEDNAEKRLKMLRTLVRAVQEALLETGQ
jgi:hypothetical protein